MQPCDLAPVQKWLRDCASEEMMWLIILMGHMVTLFRPNLREKGK